MWQAAELGRCAVMVASLLYGCAAVDLSQAPRYMHAMSKGAGLWRPPFRHLPEPLVRLRGGSSHDHPAPFSLLSPPESEITEALAAAGPAGKKVPLSVLRAVRDGRVGLEIVGRFVAAHKRLPRSLRWILQIETFRQRILADDGFVFKWTIEAMLAGTVQLVAEMQHRGDDFGSEIDFALGGIVAVLFSSSVSTLLAAPVAVPRRARRREYSIDSFFRGCPNNLFEEGPPMYTTLQRFSTLLYHMPRLFATGFLSSFVGYLYITVLLLVRHACSKLFAGGKWRRKPKIPKIPLTLTALNCADLRPEERQGFLEEVGLGALRCVRCGGGG